MGIRVLLAATLFVIAPTVLSAQEHATLLMRSGDRIVGQLIDMGGVGFTVAVAGDERQVPADDVVEIEFGDPGHPVGDGDQVSSRTGAESRPAVWLRNGDVIEGQLYDIDGNRPLRITVRTATGERQFSSAEIRKIVLAPSAPASGTSGRIQPERPTGIDVPGNSSWVQAGMVVRRGEVLTFSVTGQIQLSGDAEDIAAASGARSQRTASDAPLPNVPAGALIAKIGEGPPFAVGDATSATMPAAGQLFLGINDSRLADNTGAFRVSIQRSTTR